jgi:hypothetical protein
MAKASGEERMGYPASFGAHPGQIRAVGTKAADAATLTRQAYTSHQADLAPAGGQTAGWSTTAASAASASAWGTFVNQLASSTQSLATDLQTAASAYEQADAEAARRHRFGRVAFE